MGGEVGEETHKKKMDFYDVTHDTLGFFNTHDFGVTHGASARWRVKGLNLSPTQYHNQRL